MLRNFFFILTFFVSFESIAQRNHYWQQSLDYNIKAALNDSLHTIDGEISIQYKNNSPDTLHQLWIHLWPNAYKNDKSAFSEQLLENGNTDFYFSSDDKRGYIKKLDFTINQVKVKKIISTQYDDVIGLELNEPLLPEDSIIIATPFETKLPYVFSRGGHIGNTYQATQWYPKPAVYDQSGWHAMPYLDQGEFYSEFGNFNVAISLPQQYKIAATGILVDSSTTNDISTYRFTQNNIHDFAWFADKDFVIEKDSLTLTSGRKIATVLCHYPDSSKVWRFGMQDLHNAIKSKCEWIGEYPYSSVTVVESKLSNWGGMEYPMITLIEKSTSKNQLELLINHEVGHNWFYGILGSNERDFPWMDEGLNSYYDNRYQNTFVRKKSAEEIKLNQFISNIIPVDMQSVLLKTICSIKKDQPINTKSQDFNPLNYELIAYQKTAEWLNVIEKDLGTSSFDSMMHRYFELWKFKHPSPKDFKELLSIYAPQKADVYFELLNKKGSLSKSTNKKFKVMPFFSLKDAQQYHQVFLMPIAGFNSYDGLQPGIIFHNYTLPLSKLQYFAAPLYGLKSKAWGGIGRIGFNIYPDNKISKIETALSLSSFSNNTFVDTALNKKTLRYNKFVPEIKITFDQHNSRSSINRFIQFKSYLITENTLRFSRDTINNINIIDYPNNSYSIHQLRYVTENSRKLYPYKIITSVEKGKDFVRSSITGNYFFNYVKEGGLNVRFFMGKFFYTHPNNLESKYSTDRYQLNLTGPNGYEDYSYSNWFIGRNNFEGIASQQIMIKDGGFKIKTDLLSNKIGKTDNWLAAINFSSTVPEKYNPLSLLPIKLPFRIFADVGINSNSWQARAETEKLMYDGGIELSLLNEIVHVYFPLLYSKSFKNYINSVYYDKKLLRTMSFSIDLQSISIKRFFPLSPF